MKSNPSFEDKIEQYLLGKLPRDEHLQMERAIREQPDLAQEVELRRLEFDTAGELIAGDIRTQFQWLLEQEPESGKMSPRWSGRWYYYAVTASVVLLAVLIYRLFSNKTYETPEIVVLRTTVPDTFTIQFPLRNQTQLIRNDTLSKYLQPTSPKPQSAAQRIALAYYSSNRNWNETSSVRSDDVPGSQDAIDRAISSWQRDTYLEMLQYLDTIHTGHPRYYTAQLLLVHTNFSLGRYKEAAIAARNVAAWKENDPINSNKAYVEEAEWLFVLSLLADGMSGNDEFRVASENILRDKGHHFHDAMVSLQIEVGGKGDIGGIIVGSTSAVPTFPPKEVASEVLPDPSPKNKPPAKISKEKKPKTQEAKNKLGPFFKIGQWQIIDTIGDVKSTQFYRQRWSTNALESTKMIIDTTIMPITLQSDGSFIFPKEIVDIAHKKIKFRSQNYEGIVVVSSDDTTQVKMLLLPIFFRAYFDVGANRMISIPMHTIVANNPEHLGIEDVKTNLIRYDIAKALESTAEISGNIFTSCLLPTFQVRLSDIQNVKVVIKTDKLPVQFDDYVLKRFKNPGEIPPNSIGEDNLVSVINSSVDMVFDVPGFKKHKINLNTDETARIRLLFIIEKRNRNYSFDYEQKKNAQEEIYYQINLDPDFFLKIRKISFRQNNLQTVPLRSLDFKFCEGMSRNIMILK